jgi:hypothetical protein
MSDKSMVRTQWYRPNLHGGGTSECWVCNEQTEWVDTEQECWQHPDCDAYPEGKGDGIVHIKIVGGYEVEALA